MVKNYTYICSKHIEDRNIKYFIVNNAKSGHCKYCDRMKQVVSIRELANHIEEMVEYEYDDPYSRGAYYDKEAVYYEDRFPGVGVLYTMDLLEDELKVDNWLVIEDLSANFENDYWSEIDGIFGPTKDEYLKGGWNSFKKILKHKIRFLFFNVSLKDDFDDEHGEIFNPYFILQEVQKVINELDLFRTFSKGKLRVFRGRQHEKTEIVNSAYSLGSPPPELAKANRMSPAGISMFYGAFDIETSELEIVASDWENSVLTTGKFSNLKELTLIDFTKLRKIPSLFDISKREKRAVSRFIRDFIQDLSIPVTPDDRVHIDYIPTQVVTEYIKIIHSREKNIDGIIYNSVKNKRGKCVVLFAENSDICDKYENIDTSTKEAIRFSELDKSKTEIDLKSIKTLMLDNKNIFIKEIK